MTGDRDNRTICAVSTPPGTGGISVIRVSGPQSLSIVRSLCSFLPENPESHRVYYGLLKNPADGKPIDEVVVTWFGEGRSFTGEDTAEISCHGNPLICREIVDRLVENGALPADRGEFTYRAFMNNRLDLVQAESVLALIESRSSAASRLALRQLQGDLSRNLEKIENDTTWALAHIEAGIDFSTEGLDVVDPRILQDKLLEIEGGLRRLVDSFRSGRVLKDGLRVVLVGRPNVGKSSLLNNLLEEDRAIVTEIPGTTRDVVDGETIYEGRRFVFLDTAGLREATDRVERMGIERSRKASEEADLVLFVFDAEAGITAEDRTLLEALTPQKTLLLANKIDRLDEGALGALEKAMLTGKFFKGSESFVREKLLFVSALDTTTRSKILDLLKSRFDVEQAETSAVLSSSRHYERLMKALGNVESSRAGLHQGVGAEFIAVELKEALMAVQETLGKRFDDQIMDRVFREFCIGK